MEEAAAVRKAFSNAVKGLKHNIPQHIIQVDGNISETFRIRVANPSVLILKIQKSGHINLSLIRSSWFTAHIEGTINHIVSSEEVVYQKSYRSDKGGYKLSRDVKEGDILSVGMETHHFCSDLVEMGSSEMEMKLSY